MPYQPKLNKPATRDRLRKKRPAEITVPIALDPDALDAHREAQEEYDRAALMVRTLEGHDGAARDEAAQRLQTAEAALDESAKGLEDSVVLIRMRSIGQKKFDRLVLDHPPTNEQLAEARNDEQEPPPYNVTTFMPALVHACIIEPEDLTMADIQDYFDEWNQGELMGLWMSALTVCQAAPEVPDLPKAFGQTRS